MTVLSEGDLEVTFNGALCTQKFDESYGMSHCMKAVDFIVEFPDHFIFVELKDFQHPRAASRDVREFIQRFKHGALISDLKYKYRDSILYEWAAGRLSKPVVYWVLLAWNKLTQADLVTKTDELKRQIPLWVPQSVTWSRPIVQDCAVFNISSWNKNLPQYPVSRLSEKKKP